MLKIHVGDNWQIFQAFLVMDYLEDDLVVYFKSFNGNFATGSAKQYT